MFDQPEMGNWQRLNMQINWQKTIHKGRAEGCENC